VRFDRDALAAHVQVSFCNAAYSETEHTPKPVRTPTATPIPAKRLVATTSRRSGVEARFDTRCIGATEKLMRMLQIEGLAKQYGSEPEM
jgi:hypothetical protein